MRVRARFTDLDANNLPQTDPDRRYCDNHALPSDMNTETGGYRKVRGGWEGYCMGCHDWHAVYYQPPYTLCGWDHSGYYIAPHTPSPPTIDVCPQCRQPFEEVGGRPVYPLPNRAPICQKCETREPDAYGDDDAPIWLGGVEGAMGTGEW